MNNRDNLTKNNYEVQEFNSCKNCFHHVFVDAEALEPIDILLCCHNIAIGNEYRDGISVDPFGICKQYSKGNMRSNLYWEAKEREEK